MSYSSFVLENSETNVCGVTYVGKLLERYVWEEEWVKVKLPDGTSVSKRKTELEAEQKKSQDDEVMSNLRSHIRSKNVSFKRSDVFPQHNAARKGLKNALRSGEIDADRYTRIATRWRKSAASGKKAPVDFKKYKKVGTQES